MTLEDYEFEMGYCSRCSACKFIPANKVNEASFYQNCPAIKKYNFHSYSGSGRVIVANSLLQNRCEITDELQELIFRCQLGGACQTSCHLISDIVEPLEIARELKIRCVEEGKIPFEHMAMVEGLREEDNPFGEPKEDRGKWAEGLGVKDIAEEEADVIFHAGCRLSYDEDLRNVARGAIILLRDAGVDVGVAGREEACCGGRAFDIGYKGELEKYAEDLVARYRGANKVVTACSDCYSTFKQFYPMIGQELEFEVLHITEYLDQLIREEKLKPKTEVPKKVTYHDPCHLGRLGEPYNPWNGEWKKELGQIPIPDPPKQIRRGTEGIYDPPRNILREIPSLELVEMKRVKEYSWCCGAGGGVLEAYPDFAHWTAIERIKEVKSTGAEALVTACPWCERNFKDALEESEENLEVYDIIELLRGEC